MKTNSIELLEARIAPAAIFVNATTATFTDLDGDLVTVKFSKSGLTAANVTGVLETTPTGPLGGNQLTRIDINSNPNFAGTSITLTAKPHDAGAAPDSVKDGDGLVNVGWIDAFGIDLGAVKLPGDLGKIVAGDGTLTNPGLKSLTTGSLGFFGTTTGAPNLVTTIQGALGSLAVRGDVLGASISAGTIGKVMIGGSLLGGDATGSGHIVSAGDMGMVKIGGDMSLARGGTTNNAGTIVSTNGRIAGVTIGGTLNNLDVGISAGGDIGLVKVGRSFFGGIRATNSDVAGVAIGGSVTGGDMFLNTVNVGFLTIAGDMSNGDVDISGDLGALTVVGSDLGGRYRAANIGPVKIGADFTGSTLSTSSSGKIGAVTIGGSFSNSRINAGGDLASVKIGGSMGAHLDDFSQITSGGDMGAVTIGRDLLGGEFDDSGVISSGGDMGPVKVAGDVRGFTGLHSGSIRSGGKLASVTIGGSLEGSRGEESGAIISTGDMGAVKIGRDFRGTFIGTGEPSVEGAGYIQGARIQSVFIGGSIFAGLDRSDTGDLTRSASIRAVNDIGSITVLGSIRGTGDDPTDPDFTPVIISARGKASLPASGDVAIGKIIVGDDLQFTDILAGYDVGLFALNADAQIGAVSVGGDWGASNLIAGVRDLAAGFGNSSDVKISGFGVKDVADKNGKGAISKIASVIIKGQALGTLASGDSLTFGIEAQQIGSIKLGGAAVPLRAGAGNDLMAAGNVAGMARPLGPSFGTAISDGFDFHAFEVPVAP